jgi:hypothetical protein
MKKQVAELLQWREDKKRQQLSFPIDVASMQALNEAFRTTRFDRINITDIYFSATESSPTVPGQMRFFNNGATQNFRGNTTGSVFTGTFDLTAV